MKIILSCILSYILISCHFSDNRLHFNNQSNYTVSVSNSAYYSDTLLNTIFYNIRDTIMPGEKKIFKKPSNIKQNGWSIEIENSKDKKLKLYVFRLDVLKEYFSIYTINQIYKYGLCDTVLSYSEHQLDSMDWQVNYFGKKRLQNF